jgi:simple sugar transport system substrate-binding protein
MFSLDRILSRSTTAIFDKNRRFPPLSRRQLIRGVLATGAFAATSRLGTGCTSASEQDQSNQPIKMGFIYAGSTDDYGYNQAHAEGQEDLSQLEGIETVEQANVPETTAVQEAMRDMIELDGVSVLFPTSFGYYDPHILKVAQEYPEVQFFHCGGLYQEGDPENVGSYFGYIHQAEYVAGIVAGHTSKTGKLGFVAAKPIPQILRDINSFTLAARSVNPEIQTQVIFTGGWALPVKEAEAANSLIDQGADILTCNVDNPKVVIETAEKRGVFCSGYHTNQAALAPDFYLTGAEWDWTSVYTNYAEKIKAGETLRDGGIPHMVRGGVKASFVELSPYGSMVSEKAKEDAEVATAKLLNDNMVIYQGKIKSNQGKVVIPEGKKYQQDATKLEKMDWLVQGVMGSTTS